uniref:IS1380 family transposase n=1 Tax=Ruminococcus sp. TaxID=41978 RepID=UPI003FD80CC8
MKKIHIEFSDERLITPSGLVFVGQILGKSSFVKKINRAPISKDYLQKQIKNGDVLLTYIGMLCQGKPQYEAVREMIDDPDYYKYALGISYAIPSAETLRQRFDMIGDSLRKDIQQANVDMLREMHIEPTALDNGFVPVDIDVTPFDNSKSKKEGVSRTYKGFDGYAPIMAYIGTEGYLVNLELRIGKQHCQKETPDFLRETIELCRQLTEKPLLIRLDSGNDYGQYFIVPDIELGTYWTNTSLPDETVIDLYHAHGESEQYHSEIKTDMDVGRLPSGKFESNKLVLELTMIAYN